eukprot:TRINITY_DN957_c0_g1_i1.p1 TRINITY_DN957_c0_g1~~TRINITY_DN957_c0_g1_i1.p1  ORF type:complete len:176 (+),score=46.74 TRINITY_DN957_c0_g1_i1:112-639(+)
MECLTDMIGLHVHAVTMTDAKVEGDLFAYDPTTQLLVLQVCNRNTPRERDFHILKIDTVKSITVGPPNFETADLVPRVIPYVDLKAATQREEAVVRQVTSKIGSGVSEFAQMLFEALSKTMPCVWDGKAIIVFNDVRVSEPYTPASANGPNAESVNRVRLVIERVTEKIHRKHGN